MSEAALRRCGWAAVVLSLGAAVPLWAKSARTLYTDAKLARMRATVAKYPWGRAQQAAYVATAEAWAKRDDSFLRRMVVPPQVPRCYDLHNLGCPVHGLAANKNGLYQWKYSLDRPFKIRCPAGGEEYPSNDFAAFLASGRKDRSLVTGDYPDDGWGWNKPGDKHNYWFVAYYAHWSMQRELQQAMSALALGSVVTDNAEQARRFAHKCAVLLWQLSVHYPEYDYNQQSRESKEHNPSYTGRITNMIWEVSWADVCAQAYDAVWPFLRDDRELQQLADLDGPAIDRYIRDRLLLTMARDITSGNGRNRGNYGSHQRALTHLALALDEKQQTPRSQDMIDWVLANPRPVTDADMGLLDALENMVYRDGMPPESPGYNYIWTNGPAAIADARGERGERLFALPRFRKLLLWHYDTVVANEFQPPLGDSSNLFARAGTLSPAVRRVALQHFRDPRLVADLRAHPGDDRDLFAEPAEELLARLPGMVGEPEVPSSRHLPAYGLAMLQSGIAMAPTAAVLHYGSWRHHRHRDQLNLLLFAQKNALLCDVGYPEQTDAFNYRRSGIWSNTIAHNTVTVDARGQGCGPGRLHAYEPNGFAQVSDASCAAYPHLQLYRRAIMLVRAAPEHVYVFDVFQVRGGTQHDWALMGPQADFSCTPPLGPAQEQGTLAGPDVPYEQFYDDPALKDKPLGSVPSGHYAGSGFQFFVHVQRAPLRDRAVAEWRLSKPLQGQPGRPWKGIGVRTHVVGSDEELIAADCQPQRYRYMPAWVKHLIRRRRGTDLRSAFVSVHEPYRGEPWIESVAAASLIPNDGEAMAVRVRLRNGEQHYCFHSVTPGRSYVVDGKLRADGQAACIVLDRAGTPLRAMLLNGRKLTYGPLAMQSPGLRRSSITHVDYGRGLIELADPVVGTDLRRGQTVLVQTEGGSESVTLRQVLSATQFSIGDEDLRVGGGPVNDVLPAANRIVTRVYSPHAYPGLAVLNSRGQVQGRLTAGARLTLDRQGLPPLTPDCFPSGDNGLGPRFSIVIAAPGDTVVLPSLILYAARQ